jgi:signal transduction histidine kinase
VASPTLLPRASAAALREEIARAATRGERIVSGARLVLTAMALGRSFWLWRQVGTPASDPPVLVAVGAGAVVVVFSLYMLIGFRRAVASPALLAAATAVDAAVCFAALSTNVFWPGPGSPGLLRMPDLASPMIATAASGLRLSPPICLLAGALNLLSLCVLIALDTRSLRLSLAQLVVSISAHAALLASATLAAVLTAWLARRLVRSGALRALEAERAERSLGLVMQEHHDVRTLLSSASLNADLLLQRVARREPGGESEEIARQLREDLDRVNEFVVTIKERSLGDLLSLEAPAPAAPAAAAEAVARELALRFPETTIAIRDEAPQALARICGGPRALLRVLQNLVVNACEGDGRARARRVEIRLRAAERDDALRIEVCDDGPGFRPDQLDHEGRLGLSTKEDGSGLGLALVRGVVEASAGRLALANGAGGGAVVSVELPRASAP